MGNKEFLSVTSEVGKLKAVLLHRPGRELERLTPGYLQELLFDDIPWLKRMKEEHDQFAKVMEAHGAQVYYYEELLKDCMEDPSVKGRFIKDLVSNCNLANEALEEMIEDYLLQKNNDEIVEIAISGLHKKDIDLKHREYSLVDHIKEDLPFFINPLPNLYFTRDPGSVIGTGLSINKMKTSARDRETMFLAYIHQYHPVFGSGEVPLWYNYKERYSLEGGDILVLSDKVVAVGCSERTSARGIEILAERILKNTNFERVLAIEIPFTRAYMHLDTVFTMVNYDQFTIYPGVEDYMVAYELTLEKEGVKVKVADSLQKALSSSLGLSSVELIQSGGGDAITAAREQWNDSTNTLALAPGVVITYNRNEASNRTLRSRGIEVIEIEGSELVRGRGGPRCMSMPLIREKL